MDYQRRLQWELSVRIYHDNHGWHIVEAAQLSRGRWSEPNRLVRWRGIGVPAAALDLVTALVADEVEGHLVQRYGIQLELPHHPLGGE